MYELDEPRHGDAMQRVLIRRRLQGISWLSAFRVCNAMLQHVWQYLWTRGPEGA
jgi:hypothetical protein